MPSIGEGSASNRLQFIKRKRRRPRMQIVSRRSASRSRTQPKPGCISDRPIRPARIFRRLGPIPTEHAIRSKQISRSREQPRQLTENARRNRTKPKKIFAKALNATTGYPLPHQNRARLGPGTATASAACSGKIPRLAMIPRTRTASQPRVISLLMATTTRFATPMAMEYARKSAGLRSRACERPAASRPPLDRTTRRNDQTS